MTPQGEDRIHIEMPGVKDEDKEHVRKKIEEVAQLELRMVHPNSEGEIRKITLQRRRGHRLCRDAAQRARQDRRTEKAGTLLVKSRADLAGKHVSRAIAKLDPQEGWVIGLYLDGEGSKQFDEIAARHRGERMAIVLDGVVISDPVLKSDHYGGYAQISGGANGGFKQEEAIALATALENPLENPMEIIESSEVSAAFGAETVKQGIYTGIVGTVADRRVHADLLPPRRPGRALRRRREPADDLRRHGALQVHAHHARHRRHRARPSAWAVDANVLIYERLREEMRAGKSLAAGLATAFDKAFSAIFDVHVTTLITSLILFSLASGLVKGFAVTLIVGIFGTLFGALIVTRVVFGWFIDAHKLETVKFAEFIPTGNYDLLKYAKPFIIGSFALAVVSLRRLRRPPEPRHRH